MLVVLVYKMQGKGGPALLKVKVQRQSYSHLETESEYPTVQPCLSKPLQDFICFNATHFTTCGDKSSKFGFHLLLPSLGFTRVRLETMW